ncbi:MAG: argininosuccinate lyase, partial [Vicinamibacterales bacterium]
NYTDQELAEVLDPRHFVEVRRTLGGPAPSETARAIEEGLTLLERDARWLTQARQALAAAETELRARSQAL